MNRVSSGGAYRLPHDVADRLRSALATYRNREAAQALAIFLARFWSSRARMTKPFPVDRRALADHAELELSEARVRGALKVLEEIGFLNRGIEPPGSAYRATPDGLQRKPVLWGFGPEYGPLFAAANERAARARLRREGRAVQGSPTIIRTAIRTPETSSPKDKERSGKVVLMGDQGKRAAGGARVPQQVVPNSALEAALERLLQAGGFRSKSHHEQ